MKEQQKTTSKLPPAGTFPNYLDAFIRHRGLQKAKVAEALDVSTTTLSYYIRGRRTVPHDLRVKFAELLNCSIDELFPLPKSTSVHQGFLPLLKEHQELATRSNDFSSKFDILGCLRTNPLSIQTFQQISTLLSTPSISLQELDEQVIALWTQRNNTGIPIRVLYTRVLRLLDEFKPLLRHAWLPSERLHICDMTSRTALLAGVLLHDMGFHSQARQAMQTALQAAEEADHPALKAIIWTWMGFTWTYTKLVSLALPCILEANASIEQTSELRVKTWIRAVQAEIYALLGQREESLHCLRQADCGNDDPISDMYYLFSFDTTLLDGYRGVCFQQFYRQEDATTHVYLREAKDALERALASSPSTRRMLYYLGDLAKAEARQGEIEAACHYAIQSIAHFNQVESKSIWRRLIEVRQLLQPYQDVSYVKTLDAQIERAHDNKAES